MGGRRRRWCGLALPTPNFGDGESSLAHHAHTADAAIPPMTHPDDASASAVASLLRSSLYLDMLHDRARAAAYAAALASVVRPGDLVMDVGTGSGLLAVLAARAAGLVGLRGRKGGLRVKALEGCLGSTVARTGAARRQRSRPPTRPPNPPLPADVTVVACDQFPPMVRLAKAVVAAAGVAGRVTLHTCRSDELALPRRADVVVSEILDTCLVGEGVRPTSRDAVARLLKPGGVLVPARGRVLVQAVQCAALRACWDGAGLCGVQGGVDVGGVRGLHLGPLHAAGGLTPLGAPVVALDLDFAADDGAVICREVGMTMDAAGSVDAVAVWWDLDLAAGVGLSTAPTWACPGTPPPWTDHWRQGWGVGLPAAAAHVGVGLFVGFGVCGWGKQLGVAWPSRHAGIVPEPTGALETLPILSQAWVIASPCT